MKYDDLWSVIEPDGIILKVNVCEADAKRAEAAGKGIAFKNDTLLVKEVALIGAPEAAEKGLEGVHNARQVVEKAKTFIAHMDELVKVEGADARTRLMEELPKSETATDAFSDLYHAVHKLIGTTCEECEGTEGKHFLNCSTWPHNQKRRI